MRGMTSSLRKICVLHWRKDPSEERQRQYAVSREINNIPDYSSLHNFEFSEGGLRVWKAFGVCPWKFISWTDIVTFPQGETSLAEEIPYEGPETNFHSQEDLDLHMNVYNHRTVPSELDHL